MNEVTVWDDQDGKWVTGYIYSISNGTFTLIDKDTSKIIGKFDYSLIKHLYDHEKK